MIFRRRLRDRITRAGESMVAMRIALLVVAVSAILGMDAKAQSIVFPGDKVMLPMPIKNADETGEAGGDTINSIKVVVTGPNGFVTNATDSAEESIAPGEVETLTPSFVVDPNAPNGTYTVTLKIVSSDAGIDPDPSSQSSQVTFKVAEHMSVLDYTNILTLETLLNFNLTILHQYVHADRLCHTTEGTWEGPFYTERWSKVCKDTHGQNYCAEWTGGGCCMYCASRTDTHRGHNNLGKAFPPGTYTQLLKSDSYIPPVDNLAQTQFQVKFSPTDFPDINGRDHLSVASPPLGADDVWAITVIIPDKGQTTKLRKSDTNMGEPESGDDQTAPMGVALPKPIKVKAVKTVGATGVDGSLVKTEQPLVGVQIQFTLKDPYGNVVGNVLTTETQPDGFASISGVLLGSDPGTYTIEANCGQCFANQNVIFTATAEAIRTIIEKVPGAESGDRQKDRVGTQLPIPLRVRVKDTDGTLRSGVQVSFSVVESPAAASFSDPNPVTDEMGVASTLFTLGGVAGHYEIEAFCSVCTGNAANGTASPADRVASSASGPFSSDDRVSLSESAAEDSQEVRKNEDRTRGGQFSGAGGCQAVIVAEGSVPAGDTPPSPPPTIVGCKVNSLQDVGISMECVGDADESFTSLALCEKWDWQPHSSNAEIPARHPLRTNEFKSLNTGDFDVSADYVERFLFYERGESRCRARGKVKVGFATVATVRVDSEWVPRAGVRSGPYTFQATFDNIFNLSDLGSLVHISVTDSDDNITIYGKTSKPWNIDARTIGFIVHFDSIEGKLDAVRIRVDICGSQDFRQLDVQLF